MTEQIGIVTKTEQKGWARVAIQRTADCSGCLANPPTEGCRTCGSGPSIESRVTNPIGAQSGDMVRVHMDSLKLFKGAAVIYLLPVVFLLLGALIASWAGSSLAWQQNSTALGGGLIGLAVWLVLAMGADRAGRLGRHWTPTIEQIVVPCGEMKSHLHGTVC